MKLKIRYKSENKKGNYIGIYLFGIRVKKIYNKKKKNKKQSERKTEKQIKKENKKKEIKNKIIERLKRQKILVIKNILNIISTVKVDKLKLDLGINLNDPIYNAYLIAIINSLLSLYLANKAKDLHAIYYNTFISEKIIHIDIETIISIPIIINIPNILSIITIVLKKENSDKLKEASKLKTKCLN